MKFPTAAPYIASYVIFRDGQKVAFVLRSHTGWMDKHYGLVAGKVEKNETFQQAAIREAKEEAGVVVAAGDLNLVLMMHRHELDSDWVDVFFEAKKWSGQLHNTEPQMHSKLEWLNATNLPTNVIPGTRFALEEIEKGKIYTEYGWEK